MTSAIFGGAPASNVNCQLEELFSFEGHTEFFQLWNCMCYTQPMTSAILGGAPAADVERQLRELSAFKGHTAAAEDVANAIAFLASGEAAAITGANLLIDTGLLTGIGGKPAFGGGSSPAAPPP